MNNKNKLIHGAMDSKFTLPSIGVFSLGFMLFVVSQFISGNIVFKLLQKFSELNDIYTHLELFSNIVIIVVFGLWVRLVEKRDFKSMGFFKENAWKDLLKGFVVGIVSFLVIVLIMKFMGVIKFGGWNIGITSILGVIFIIPFWAIQAGSEELFARGFVLPEVSAKLGKVIGIVLSSIAFTMIHLGNNGISTMAVVNIMIVGVLLALYALYKENLWGVIGFHAAWNYVQGCILGLPVSGVPLKTRLMSLTTTGNELISGGKFGIEASIITTIVLTLMTIYVAMKLAKKSSDNQ